MNLVPWCMVCMVWGIARLHNPVSWQPATSSMSVALQTGPRHSSHRSRSAGLAMSTNRWMMYGMSFYQNVCTIFGILHLSVLDLLPLSSQLDSPNTHRSAPSRQEEEGGLINLQLGGSSRLVHSYHFMVLLGTAVSDC